jgi:hypothetical protein
MLRSLAILLRNLKTLKLPVVTPPKNPNILMKTATLPKDLNILKKVVIHLRNLNTSRKSVILQRNPSDRNLSLSQEEEMPLKTTQSEDQNFDDLMK